MTLIKSISGIRGTIGGLPGDNLTPLDVVKFCSAFCAVHQEKNQRKEITIIIGRDDCPTGFQYLDRDGRSCH
jgi:phosphomannomutase